MFLDSVTETGVQEWEPDPFGPHRKGLCRPPGVRKQARNGGPGRSEQGKAEEHWRLDCRTRQNCQTEATPRRFTPVVLNFVARNASVYGADLLVRHQEPQRPAVTEGCSDREPAMERACVRASFWSRRHRALPGRWSDRNLPPGGVWDRRHGSPGGCFVRPGPAPCGIMSKSAQTESAPSPAASNLCG